MFDALWSEWRQHPCPWWCRKALGPACCSRPWAEEWAAAACRTCRSFFMLTRASEVPNSPHGSSRIRGLRLGLVTFVPILVTFVPILVTFVPRSVTFAPRIAKVSDLRTSGHGSAHGRPGSGRRARFQRARHLGRAAASFLAASAAQLPVAIVANFALPRGPAGGVLCTALFPVGSSCWLIRCLDGWVDILKVRSSLPAHQDRAHSWP